LIITFFKYRTINELDTQINLYVEIEKYAPSYILPKYIKVYDFRRHIKGYRLFKIYKGKYIYVNVSYIEEGFKKFVFTLFLWEISLSFVLILMVYYILKRFLKKEQEHKRLLEFILGMISHKFGNFLSVQRVNLELIDAQNKKAFERIKEAYDFMEKDFQDILKIMRNTEQESVAKDNVEYVVERCIDAFQDRLNDKKIHLSLTDASVASKNDDFYNAIYELIDNASKYSKTYIRIKAIKKRKKLYIIVSNDINSKKSGSGFGLKLVEYLSAKNGWQFDIKAKNNTFCAALTIKL